MANDSGLQVAVWVDVAAAAAAVAVVKLSMTEC